MEAVIDVRGLASVLEREPDAPSVAVFQDIVRAAFEPPAVRRRRLLAEARARVVAADERLAGAIRECERLLERQAALLVAFEQRLDAARAVVRGAGLAA